MLLYRGSWPLLLGARIATRNKATRALLLGARMLRYYGAPGIATRSKKLLGAPELTTRSSWPYY